MVLWFQINQLLLQWLQLAAININSTTVHTALSIPKESGDFVLPMSDQKRTQLILEWGVRVRGDAGLRCFWCGFSEIFF